MQRTCQLNEKPQTWREAGEHQMPTVAQGEPNDRMIEKLLKELEELNELHELFEVDEAMIDAILQELELEIALQSAEIERKESLVNCDASA